jgi:DNA-directed RNA polymerase subunit RPC12/RpoP
MCGKCGLNNENPTRIINCPECGQAIEMRLTRNVKTASAPSEIEVKSYAKEIDFDIDAEAFLAYYEARDWRLNGRKIKSWQACVRTWKTRAKNQKSKAQTQVDRNIEITKEWLK